MQLINPDVAFKFPYATFRRVAKHVEKDRSIREEVEEVKIRIDGVHGTLESLREFKKKGMLLIGYGNLNPGKDAQLLGTLKLELGEMLDPRLNELRNSPVAQRAEGLAEEEGGADKPRRGRPPSIKPVD